MAALDVAQVISIFRQLAVEGDADAVRGFVDGLRADFPALRTKECWSNAVPFGRLLVKVKREIIRMDRPEVRPQDGRAPAVSPAARRAWSSVSPPPTAQDLAT